MSYRVLSLWQPWATLCVAPHDLTGNPPKRFETRSWAPRIPVPFTVAIHATARWGREQVEAVTYEPSFRRALMHCGYLPAPTKGRAGVLADPKLRPLPMGAIIGIAHVIEIIPTGTSLFDFPLPLSEYESAFGDYSSGRFAWRLKDAYPLREPIPYKGRQEALYLLDDQIAAAIDDQFQGRAIA